MRTADRMFDAPFRGAADFDAEGKGVSVSRNAAGRGGARGLTGAAWQGAVRAFYRRRLIGLGGAELRVRVGQTWPGDAPRGRQILAGDLEFDGELLRNPSPLWFPPAASPEWLCAWHGFGWLADLLAGEGAGRDKARELLASWLGEETLSHPLAWRSDVLGTRIFAWLTYLDEILRRGEDEPLRQKALSSLANQLGHLASTAASQSRGRARLVGLKGLIAGIAAFGGREPHLSRAVAALEREIALQIRSDGGHISRNPSLQLRVLQDLGDIRATLRAIRFVVPRPLDEAIERMAPMLRFFRHGDRRLALFNGSLEEDGVLIDLVLTRSEAKGRAPANAPESGFQRLEIGKSLLLVDTGKPPPEGYDEEAHAGPLSFEFSHERERIVVNCGAYRGPNASWQAVARASAAHSVLVVADTNSVEIRKDGTIGRVPRAVTAERAEDKGQQWIAASHDGYRERFGLGYARQLFLSADGEDLRGEDRLSGLPGARFAVRFHLHPAVEASLSDDRKAVLLRLQSGALWRLRAAGAEMSLGESVYLGSGRAQKTQQVILSGSVAPEGATVRWAVRREPRKTAAD